MGPGSRPEDQDQHDQDRPGRQGVAEQGESDLRIGQAFGHDAGADHGGEQQGGAKRLGGEPLGGGMLAITWGSGLFRRRAGRRRLADIGKPLLQGQAIQGRQRQIDEDIDAVVQHAEGLFEGQLFLRFAALGRRRIWYAPVSSYGLAGPERADLAGGVVADGKIKSKVDAPGWANSSQLLERKSPVG